MKERLASLLASDRWPWVAGVISLLLCLPALWTGLGMDDYLQAACVRGLSPHACTGHPVRELFSFLPGPGPVRQGLAEHGWLAWWVTDTSTGTFLRPLSALTHVLDDALWRDRLPLHHLHSILWMAAAVVAASAIFRRLYSGVAAGLAALFFAADEAHQLVAGWLAGRNGAVALLFGLLALLAHHRWRSGDGRRWLAAFAGALLAGIAAGEGILGLLPWLLAYEVALGRGPAWRRALALAPATVPVLAWRALLDLWDYRIAGSGLYLDPTSQPLEFLLHLPERWLVLLFSMWTPVSVGAWAFIDPPGRLALSLAGAAVAAGVLLLVRPLLGSDRPLALFYLLGMSLSLVPSCAAFPMERLTLWASLGAFGLLGLAVERATSASRPRKIAVGTLAVLHGPVAATQLAGSLAVGAVLFGALAGASRLPAEAAVPGRTVVWVNGTDLGIMGLPAIASVQNEIEGRNDWPVPSRLAVVGPFFDDFEIERMDDTTLRIRDEDGLFSRPFERLFVDPRHRWTPGLVIRRPTFDVEVVDVTAGGRPRTVDFRFRVPLEDPTLVWWIASRDGPAFVLPRPGERRAVPAFAGLLERSE